MYLEQSVCRGGEYENTGAEVSEMRVYTIIYPYKPDIHTILLVCIPPFMTHTFIPIHLHLHSSHSLTHSHAHTYARTHSRTHILNIHTHTHPYPYSPGGRLLRQDRTTHALFIHHWPAHCHATCIYTFASVRYGNFT